MVFSSKVFLFAFLPVVLAFYVITPKRLKNYLLLAVSLFFYGFGEPKFVSVMVASIVLNYLTAIILSQCTSSIKRKLILVFSIVLNISMLFVFKYLDFSISSVNRVLGTNFALRKIALPIGISFFTFQALSYVIDVYRGNVPVQKNPMKLGMYIAFFPQLIAGPIVRYSDIVYEIDNRIVTLDGFTKGVRRFIIGLSKKVLIADIMALNADQIFALRSDHLTSPIAWVGIIAYTFQIYFDFSGYSDMAIGLGHMFGFHFLENFDYPYESTSVTEFWRKWHISLSSWFRDYLYIPMGGNRRGNVYVNLMIVFLTTGMWHGASFTFILWGIWHGVFLIIERIMKERIKTKPAVGVPKLFKHLITILIVMLGWVIFRSETISYAYGYIKAMFGMVSEGFKPYNVSLFLDRRILFTTGVALIASTDIARRAKKRMEDRKPGSSKVFDGFSYIATLVLLFLCILFVMNQGYSPFIYFRF